VTLFPSYTNPRLRLSFRVGLHHRVSSYESPNDKNLCKLHPDSLRCLLERHQHDGAPLRLTALSVMITRGAPLLAASAAEIFRAADCREAASCRKTFFSFVEAGERVICWDGRICAAGAGSPDERKMGFSK
jgi:hypothetical protein